MIILICFFYLQNFYFKFLGTTIVAAAERLYFCDLHTSVIEDVRPVIGGIGCCERSGRMWLIGRKHACLTDLRTGRVLKKMTLLDPDRTDASETSKVSQQPNGEKNDNKNQETVSPEEDVTVVTSGKNI